MAKPRLEELASLGREERAELERLAELHEGLDDVFAWGRAQSPPVVPTDVVRQDEYTHDVIVPLPSGRWLVYATT